MPCSDHNWGLVSDRWPRFLRETGPVHLLKFRNFFRVLFRDFVSFPDIFLQMEQPMFVISVGRIVKQAYEFPFIIINGGAVGKGIGHLGGVRKVGEDVSLVHGLAFQRRTDRKAVKGLVCSLSGFPVDPEWLGRNPWKLPVLSIWIFFRYAPAKPQCMEPVLRHPSCFLFLRVMAGWRSGWCRPLGCTYFHHCRNRRKIRVFLLSLSSSN